MTQPAKKPGTVIASSFDKCYTCGELHPASYCPACATRHEPTWGGFTCAVCATQWKTSCPKPTR